MIKKTTTLRTEFDSAHVHFAHSDGGDDKGLYTRLMRLKHPAGARKEKFMKRIIAKGLVVLMFLTLVAIPAGGEKPAEAAAKRPMMDISGGIENFKMLIKKGMVQQVGKSMTITVKNVKKSNLKDITYYVDDPSVATVTEKKITKKRIGFKVNIKKLGRTVLRTCITLKNKQAGEKIWVLNTDVTGVKVMSKKELAAFPKKYCEGNDRSVLLNKHGSFVIHGKIYYEAEKEYKDYDNYQSNDDCYVREKYYDNNEVYHTYLKSNIGYQVMDRDNPFSGFYFCMEDLSQNEYLLMPNEGASEWLQKMLETTNPEYLYYDGSRYYYSDVSKPEEEFWLRTETVYDSKTYEMITTDFYRKTDEGKEYLEETQTMETAVEMPDMYKTMKYQFSADAKKKVKVDCIIDSGQAEERRISYDVPAGAPVKLGRLEGYDKFLDAEGKTPLPDDYDTYSDLTVYYIKAQADA